MFDCQLLNLSLLSFILAAGMFLTLPCLLNDQKAAVCIVILFVGSACFTWLGGALLFASFLECGGPEAVSALF